MQPLKTLVWGVCASTVVFGSVSRAWADAKPNPYLSIVERNPFGLKDPPPPPVPQEEKPATLPSKVILTGITSLFGPTSKRCFLEITEQEPGKPGVLKRPILREGEKDGSVEVVSIDVEKNIVHLRNNGQELDLKFEDPSKVASAAPRPTAPGSQPAPYHPAPTATYAPTIISPGSAENSSRNSSVNMFGAQMAANDTANGANTAANSSALASAPGYSPIVASRSLRGQSDGHDPLATEKQYVNMMANHESSQQSGTGRPIPPLPPPPDRSIYQNRGNAQTPGLPGLPTP